MNTRDNLYLSQFHSPLNDHARHVQAGIITRLATDRDIFDLGMLAIKTKWGLKRKPED